jgi:putative membrane protein (TIGR04086 family)
MKAMLLGMLMHAITLSLIFLLFAAICFALPDPTPYTTAFSLGALIFSAAASGFAVAKTNKEQGFVFTLLCALPIAAILIILSLTVPGGAPISTLINASVYLVTSLLFSQVGKRRNKRRRHKRRS